jgi:membrane protease subunit HflC
MRLITILIALFLAAVVALQSFFIVNETELAIKFRFGEVVATDFGPGAHLKVPFINNVRKFDDRILSLDTQPRRFLTSESKNVEVDYFVQWRIADVRRFWQATSGDYFRAGQRIGAVIEDGLRNEFGIRTLRQLVAEQRAEVVASLTESADQSLAELGVSIVEVRIKKIELPGQTLDSVFSRMRAERERLASELRAEGRENAERIRSEAEREARVIVAEAQRDATAIRGSGDAEAAAIYRQSYGQAPEFFSFLRSLQAYEQGFSGQGDVMVLDPNAPFFRYFQSSDLDD